MYNKDAEYVGVWRKAPRRRRGAGRRRLRIDTRHSPARGSAAARSLLVERRKKSREFNVIPIAKPASAV